MIRENAAAASRAEAGEMSTEEKELLKAVVKAINKKMKVGCTGCAYCMPCPMNVDIPGTFSAYNRRHTESKFWALADYVKCTALRKTPTPASNCIGCGKCVKHCPQAIDIPVELEKARHELEIPIYKLVLKLQKKFKVF